MDAVAVRVAQRRVAGLRIGPGVFSRTVRRPGAIGRVATGASGSPPQLLGWVARRRREEDTTMAEFRLVNDAELDTVEGGTGAVLAGLMDPACALVNVLEPAARRNPTPGC